MVILLLAQENSAPVRYDKYTESKVEFDSAECDIVLTCNVPSMLFVNIPYLSLSC